MMRQREKQSHYHLPNTSPIQLLSAQHVTDGVSVCPQSICLYLFWVQTTNHHRAAAHSPQSTI